MTRCACGLSYVRELASDEELHGRVHAEFHSGAELHLPVALASIGSVHGYPIVVADMRTPLATRRALARIALVAQRSMPDFPIGYDGSLTDDDDRLFVVLANDRMIAMAITSLDDSYWVLQWRENLRLELVGTEQLPDQRQKVSRVWVANQFRRRGIARGLIDSVATLFRRRAHELGWELPLTTDGRRLLRTLVPGDLFGHGDTFALEETLD